MSRKYWAVMLSTDSRDYNEIYSLFASSGYWLDMAEYFAEKLEKTGEYQYTFPFLDENVLINVGALLEKTFQETIFRVSLREITVN